MIITSLVTPEQTHHSIIREMYFLFQQNCSRKSKAQLKTINKVELCSALLGVSGHNAETFKAAAAIILIAEVVQDLDDGPDAPEPCGRNEVRVDGLYRPEVVVEEIQRVFLYVSDTDL